MVSGPVPATGRLPTSALECPEFRRLRAFQALNQLEHYPLPGLQRPVTGPRAQDR